MVSTDALVSVPLRGSGDETSLYGVLRRLALPFPSPCGEVVMKLGVKPMGTHIELYKGFRPLAGKW